MFRVISVMAIVAMLALGVYGGAVLFFPNLVPLVAGLGAVPTVPTQINHQGVVSVAGVRFSGSGQFKFAIVDPDTGNNVWTNDGSKVPGQSGPPDSAVTLTVTDGVYNVALGSGSMTPIAPAVFADSSLALRLWFSDGTNGWQQLSPDHPLCSVPYAMTANNGVPAGTVVMTARTSAPTGWLLCDGSAVSTTEYPGLFAAIGYTYGGSGESFNLPDYRDRLPMGARQVDGGVPKSNVSGSLAASGGQSTRTLTTTELPAHTHTGTTGTGNAMWYRAVAQAGASAAYNHVTGYSSGNYSDYSNDQYPGSLHTHNFTTASAGSGQAFSILNPYLATFYIIKY